MVMKDVLNSWYFYYYSATIVEFIKIFKGKFFRFYLFFPKIAF